MKLTNNEMRLIKLLKKSKRPVKAYEITRLLSMKDTRELRFLIQSLRMKGYFICGSKDGYYFGSVKDFERYKSYGITILRTYFRMLKNAGNENNYRLQFEDVINEIDGGRDEER